MHSDIAAARRVTRTRAGPDGDGAFRAMCVIKRVPGIRALNRYRQMELRVEAASARVGIIEFEPASLVAGFAAPEPTLASKTAYELALALLALNALPARVAVLARHASDDGGTVGSDVRDR